MSPTKLLSALYKFENKYQNRTKIMWQTVSESPVHVCNHLVFASKSWPTAFRPAIFARLNCGCLVQLFGQDFGIVSVCAYRFCHGSLGLSK